MIKGIYSLSLLLLLSGCIPRIEVAPPKEPVTINMNVKVDHEIHIKMDDQVKTLLEQQSELLKPITPPAGKTTTTDKSSGDVHSLDHKLQQGGK